MKRFRIVFANQSIDKCNIYQLIRESKSYLFFIDGDYTLRVHKKTLNCKRIKEGENKYKFDSPKAIIVVEI